MASSSQLPTSQEIANEQNPSTAANPIHPDPASSPQSDSIDALFSTEAADAVVDSLTSEGRNGVERGMQLLMKPRGLSDAALPETPELGWVFTINLKTQSCWR
jgi:hypothetical protein